MSVVAELVAKSMSIEEASQKALQNEAVLKELLQGVLSHQDDERYNCYKTLLLISEQYAVNLYPYWGHFEKMLYDTNSNYQAIAIQILANLAAVDSKNQFENIFNPYFKILEGDKTVTSAYIVGNAWKIAIAKPAFISRVTEKLLNIEQCHHGKQIDLIKGYAIESFGHYYGEADTEDKKRILQFVNEETKSKSPRTKKAAKAFLEEWK